MIVKGRETQKVLTVSAGSSIDESEDSPHHYKMPFGRYQGVPITQVPIQYLFHLQNMDPRTPQASEVVRITKLEIERRKVPNSAVVLTFHAVDQASMRLLDKWRALRRKEEGLASWLIRFSEAAIRSGTLVSDDTVYYKGVKMVFTTDTEYPILKTVMELKKKRTSHYNEIED